MRREVKLGELEGFFSEPPGPQAIAKWGGRISRLFSGLPEVVRVKIWDRNATVIWSDEAQLVGQRFPDNDELTEALAGQVAVEIQSLEKAEQRYERPGFSTLAEVYVPIFTPASREVLGVIEVYKSGIDLAERLTAARPGMRILFTSGYAGDRLGQRRFTGDPSELLQKPFTPEGLLQRVRRAFDAR